MTSLPQLCSMTTLTNFFRRLGITKEQLLKVDWPTRVLGQFSFLRLKHKTGGDKGAQCAKWMSVLQQSNWESCDNFLKKLVPRAVVWSSSSPLEGYSVRKLYLPSLYYAAITEGNLKLLVIMNLAIVNQQRKSCMPIWNNNNNNNPTPVLEHNMVWPSTRNSQGILGLL